jgi:hypothetical protein
MVFHTVDALAKQELNMATELLVAMVSFSLRLAEKTRKLDARIDMPGDRAEISPFPIGSAEQRERFLARYESLQLMGTMLRRKEIQPCLVATIS